MNNIYLLGDIHGKYAPIRNLYSYLSSFYDKNIKPDESDVLILLGDVGANFFFNERDIKFKKKLGNYKFTYFVIRGNHEQRPSICAKQEPDKWELQEFFDNDVWVEKEFPYIKYTMDYPCTYFINKRKVFVFPGAYSVDKYYRLANEWTWFEKEQLSEQEMETGRRMINLQNKKCDIVLSHTCPFCYEPTDLFMGGIDQSMVDKTMERYLGEIEWEIDYKLWFWGHFHSTRVYPADGHKQSIMLYNDEIFDLKKYWDTLNPYESLIKLYKENNEI